MKKRIEPLGIEMLNLNDVNAPKFDIRPLSKPSNAVRNGRNQVKSESEAFPAVTVNAGKNSEYLHFPESVFIRYPQQSNDFIVRFILLRKRTFLRLF
jgi:hypothetical protein